MSTSHMRGLDHAIEQASKGWPVVPYLDNANGTQLKGWNTRATTDMNQIHEWFDTGAPYENAYVGIVPALVNKTCIDIDVHEGKANGFETLRDLKIPCTAMVSGTSRSGKGTHLWFHGTATSRPIYSGVDRKSSGGLVRVTYPLPDVEDVYEALPKHFQVHNNQAIGTEYEGSYLGWLEMHGGKPSSPKVSALLSRVPDPFVGHEELLRVQTSLVKYAVEGHGGVPEALTELRGSWLASEHKTGISPSVEWSQALVGAICAFGGEKPQLKYEELHPDSFFEKSHLLTEFTAKAISHDLAIGIDQYIWSYKDGVWSPDPKVVERRLYRLLRNRYNLRYVPTITSAITEGIGIPKLPEKPDSTFINLRNCMLNWRTGEVTPHSAEYLSSIQMNFDFEKDAESPLFDHWLEEVLPKELHGLFWELFGYMFLVGNPLQKALLIFGRGGTGKSTFLRLLEHMLGYKNVSNVTLRGMSQGVFDRAQLFGKIANIAGDIDSKFLEDSSGFKQITGEDTIQAQHKHQQLFRFNAFAVPIFSANKIWRTADTSDSYFRRWVVIPFQHQVDRKKNFDESVLHEEASGIFNKALIGLQRLMEKQEFNLDGAALELFNEFQAESDIVRQWLRDDESVALKDVSIRSLKTNVYGQYRDWCGRNGLKVNSAPEFNKSMAALGFTEKKTDGGKRYWEGIEIIFKVDDYHLPN